MTRRDAASEAQVRAADPGSSTWLSANAGSGKTRVLTDRVARLLLARVLPQHILCLTYTKAAASEMQNRLFQRLGAWAMRDTEKLRQELQALGADLQADDDALNHARTLFARAIETPGGLKIQTIHSFCAALLRRFPLEAGVSPQFMEMDDRSQKILREEIVDQMAAGPNADVVDGLARYYTGEDLNKLIGEICKNRDYFEPENTRTDIFRALEIDPDLDEADIAASVFLGGEESLLSDLATLLAAGSKQDVTNGQKLAGFGPFSTDLAYAAKLETLFLTGASAASPHSAKIGSFPTKATQAALGPRLDALHALMARVEAARDRRVRLEGARKTWALYQFAQTFLPIYEDRKLRHGWLDFDDLIAKARALLRDPGVAEWVLFKLDGGIDHILVDEAQDTSPAQWDVIELLAREFTAGEGVRPDTERTIFVVGDKKQSIYSFQGADPDGFDRMRTLFQERLANIGAPFQDLRLEYSFRSAEPILRLVDTTAIENGHRGLGGEVLHKAFKSELPGRVDLWPLIPKGEAPAKRDWQDPTDMVAENDPAILLAGQIVDHIKSLLETGSVPAENKETKAIEMHRVTPGDILILVQSRTGALFPELIRACKAAELPIAGADRLKIGAELAVKDLTALLSFLSLQEDDLSLAAALRSPLFGWSEQALFTLAHHRKPKAFLWEALREARDQHKDTVETLDALRKEADYLRPYELLERCLTRFGGRARLLARLGPEAEEGIDALLAQALVYERTEVPSLTGFLTWLAAEEVEIKRQMDSAGGKIRVMTVHGSKGLESPIVILPDTAARTHTLRDDLIALSPETLVWKSPTGLRSTAEEQALTLLKQRQEEERMRLLYVAMTRAEKWLIVCGAGDAGKDGKSWHALIEAGMKAAGAVAHAQPTGLGLRMAHGDWPAAQVIAASDPGPDTPLPAWVAAPLATPERPAKPLSPSDLGGAKALPGEGAVLDAEAAKRRGTLLHLLLERLPDHPRDAWPELATLLLQNAQPDLPDALMQELLAEATKVLSAPDLAHLFGPDALAEVAISADLPSLGQRIHGSIDRLLVTPDRVLAVDFKSNVTVPRTEAEVPAGILRQLGAYAQGLEQIYPNRPIETAILWTRTAALMPIRHEVVTAALRDATIS